MTRVFISYSHDSDSHRQFVADLSARLRQDGLDCHIDQYINGFPSEGWQRWMEDQIEQADFVLMVCTPIYLKRYQGKERLGGKGVTFEGVVVSQHLYDSFYQNDKFIPIIPEHGSYNNVPIALKAFNTYTLQTQYDDLYRYLTSQPKLVTPPIGPKRVLSPQNGKTNTTAPVPKIQANTSGITSINAERKERLEEKLRRLYNSYDHENREDEKMRLEAVIQGVKHELTGL